MSQKIQLELKFAAVFSQKDHEGGAGVEELAQGGADGQADEAGAGAHEASTCKVQNTSFNDKDNLRSTTWPRI